MLLIPNMPLLRSLILLLLPLAINISLLTELNSADVLLTLFTDL